MKNKFVKSITIGVSVFAISLAFSGLKASASENSNAAVGEGTSNFASAAVDLASVMRAMNNDLRTIASHATDPAQNQASAKIASDFVSSVELAKTFVPDSIASLPASQRPARLTLFKKMLDDVISTGKQLTIALQKNQNAQAVEILKTLASLKADGHGEFN